MLDGQENSVKFSKYSTTGFRSNDSLQILHQRSLAVSYGINSIRYVQAGLKDRNPIIVYQLKSLKLPPPDCIPTSY
jgi:hypothetical protein